MESFAKIGVDGWSVVLYLINYVLLFLVLGWFLYKPVRKMMNDRKNSIQSSMKAAETLQGEMEEMMKKQAKDRDDALAEMHAEKKAFEKMMEEKKQTMLAEMEHERSALLEQTREQIAQQKAQVMHDVEAHIVGLIKKVLFSVLSYHVPDDVVKDSVKKAWDQSKTNLR